MHESNDPMMRELRTAQRETNALRETIQQLRALATGWTTEAEGLRERAAQCIGVIHDALDGRAGDYEDHAEAIFAIVGRE